MPEQNNGQGRPDVIGGLAAKFGEAAISRFFGNDVPESDKAAILDALTDVLGELAVINRYFAENVFNRFGDPETGDLRKKPDMRDFLAAWTQATIRLMAEEELARQGVQPGDADDGDGEGGGEDEDGGGEGDGPTVDAEYRRV